LPGGRGGAIIFFQSMVPYLKGVCAVESADEQAIFDEIEGFTTVWNAGDAQAAAAFFTEDAVRVGAFGDTQHGRTEIAGALDRLLHQGMPGASVKQERGTIRMLTPDLAVWQGGIEITPPAGLALKGHVVQVMKKVAGRWLVLEAHPKFFPPPAAR
jgi:uncharacterized protein (TIGR02246 family)